MGETKPPPAKAPATPPPEPEPLSDLEQWAEVQLVPPDDPKVVSSLIFVTTGRRPMRRYPKICLTRPDLVEIRQLYERAEIRPSEFSRPFKKVDSKLKKWLEDGKSPDRADAKSWLIGWAFQETLKELKQELDLKRSEKYLAEASS